MITDALLRLSGTNATPPVPQTPNYNFGVVHYSTNAIDLQSGTNLSGGTSTSQNRDIGEGEDLYATITIAAAAAGGTTGMIAEVIVSDDVAGTTNALVVGTFGNLTIAAMAAGANFVARINPQLATRGQRYMQLRFTNGATTNISGLTFYADIVTDIYDSRKFYAGGFTVS